MLLAGDEFGNTQQGNNNAYCQDNELSWIDWDHTEEQQRMLRITQQVIHLKHKHPVLRRRMFLQGRPIRGSEIKDITWLDLHGEEMTDEDWNAGFIRAFAVRLAGDAITEMNTHGEHQSGDTLLLFFNAHHEPMTFMIPSQPSQKEWELVLDSSATEVRPRHFPSNSQYLVQPRTIVILSQSTT